MKKILNCHPSLYYTAEDLQAVKDRIEADSAFTARYEALKAKGDAIFDKPMLTEEEADSVYSQHGRYFEIGELLEETAGIFPLLSFVTGEDKYFAYAKKILLYYAGFTVWTGPENGARRTPWHAELATTRILNGFCQLYDAYYDLFTEQERSILEQAMIEKGIDPLYADWVDPTRRVHALDSMGHNWWSVCVGYCGEGLITLYDKIPDAEEKLTYVIKALQGFCDYQGHPLLNKVPNFDKKGMFYESAGYFAYGVGELLNFILLYTRGFDEKELVQFPVLSQVGDAILSMTYPTSDRENPVMLVNFGDSATAGSGIGLLCKMLLLCGYGDDRHTYCYHVCNAKSSALDLIYDAILHKEVDATCFEGMNCSEMYPDTGYGFWRSGWQPDAALLGIRCGYTWNHAHNDAGSFVLWAGGKPLLTDSGSTNYSSPHYRGYFTTPQAHNLVNVKGRGNDAADLSILRGTKFRGTMPEYHKTDWLEYALCDATGPMADRLLRNYRSFIKLDEELFVIVDDLLAFQEETYQWLLHYEGTADIRNTKIRIKNQTAAVEVIPVFPACVTKEKTAPVGGAYSTAAKTSDQTVSYLCRETETPARDACFIHLLSLGDGAVTPLSGESYEGVQIQKGTVTWRVFYNKEADGRKMHENSNNRLGDYDTDGYILVERTENGRQQCFMAYGSYLRRGERVLYDSFTKDFVFIQSLV